MEAAGPGVNVSGKVFPKPKGLSQATELISFLV
jgi:hypothetical protein